jgi:hypothetical protein
MEPHIAETRHMSDPLAELVRPTIEHEALIDTLVRSFAVVIDDGAGTYVSSPLTTGARAFEWHRRNVQAPASFAADVIEPNREEAARFVRWLRLQMSGKVIVDPTAMNDVPDWSQSDYRYFWGRVVEDYCDTLVLRDGWQFSSGCSYEFLIGWKKKVRLLREDLEVLTDQEAMGLLRDAIVETEAHGTSADFLKTIEACFASLRDRRGHR